MSLGSFSAELRTDLHVENDLEVNSEGRFYVLTFIYPEDKEEPLEGRIEFEELIDEVISFYRTFEVPEGIGQLYSIAHELTRHAERLREVAGYMEEGEWGNWYDTYDEGVEPDDLSYGEDL